MLRRDAPGVCPPAGLRMRRAMRDLPPAPSANAGPPRVARPVVTRHKRRRVHPYSRSVTHLSHSETVGDAARGAPHRSPPQPTSVAPACWAGVRVVAGCPAPRWYETCGERGPGARGVLCVRHACCSFVGRTRRLDARRDHTGPGHRIRKETDDATERHHDAWGGSHRA